MTWLVETGDMRLEMATLPAGSVDAVVCDPPYGLSFMGAGWDHGVPGPQFWEAAWRPLKPGGFLLAFGSPRTFHRLAVAIEDAGFEIRDCLIWLYGSGMPKHRTLLKPAWEPIVLARKPGPGSLNVEACRLPILDAPDYGVPGNGGAGYGGGWTGDGRVVGTPLAGSARHNAAGRRAPNVCLDEEAAALLDAEAGDRTAAPSGPNPGKGRLFGNGEGIPALPGVRGYPDSGGPSRFFYVAKASRKERDAGLEDFPLGRLDWSKGEQSPGTFQSPGTDRVVRNHHPTVKPLALMRWLVSLVTPPGGLVADPFLGSGSTGAAAVPLGFRFWGCDLSPEFSAIARARIQHWGGPLWPGAPDLVSLLALGEVQKSG